MKYTVIGGAVFLFSGAAALAAVAFMGATEGSAASANSTDAGQTAKSIPAGDEVVLSVPDMHCEFACAPKVRETLAGVPGVENVETNVETQTVTVVTRGGFDLEKALAAMEGAGYPAKATAN